MFFQLNIKLDSLVTALVFFELYLALLSFSTSHCVLYSRGYIIFRSQVNKSRGTPKPASANRKHDEVPDLELSLSKSNEALKSLAKVR